MLDGFGTQHTADLWPRAGVSAGKQSGMDAKTNIYMQVLPSEMSPLKHSA